jgi:hypothetical protein
MPRRWTVRVGPRVKKPAWRNCRGSVPGAAPAGGFRLVGKAETLALLEGIQSNCPIDRPRLRGLISQSGTRLDLMAAGGISRQRAGSSKTGERRVERILGSRAKFPGKARWLGRRGKSTALRARLADFACPVASIAPGGTIRRPACAHIFIRKHRPIPRLLFPVSRLYSRS